MAVKPQIVAKRWRSRSDANSTPRRGRPLAARQRVTGQLHADSRKVGPGDGFIAWPGAATDGRRFVPAALAQGASCLPGGARRRARRSASPATPSRPTAGLKAATGPIAAAYYENPSQQLDVLAVTGTNGKTSTAWWLAQALSNLKQPTQMPCGLVGTLGIGQPPDVEFHRPDHARPGAAAAAVAPLCRWASRPAPSRPRRSASWNGGWTARTSAWPSSPTSRRTTWTTTARMEAYWAAKAALFRWPGLQAAVINLDDARGRELAAQLDAGGSMCGRSPACAPARLRRARHPLRPRRPALDGAGRRRAPPPAHRS
jgi:UDP-N-acetylmuramyl tripeptide synthase